MPIIFDFLLRFYLSTYFFKVASYTKNSSDRTYNLMKKGRSILSVEVVFLAK